MSTDNTCPICYDTLDSNSITLKCKHTFHYNCILTAYKSNISKKSRHIRNCPYCRNKCEYLPLIENVYPCKGIHVEFYEIEQCLIRNETEKLKMITEKYIDKSKCNAILKSGINKGNQCKKSKKKGLDYCHLHNH